MAPLNVLHLRDTHEIGGPGKTILETFKAMDPASVSLHLGVFLTRKESADNPFTIAARRAGMPVHELRGFNQYDPALIWRVAALVRRLQIDILHAHEVKSDVIALVASRLRRVRTVTTLHGWIGNGLRQRAFTSLDKKVVRHFDRVIVVSRRMRETVAASGVPEPNIAVLHNAIVLRNYERTGERGFLRRLLGREVPPPVICSIGRISPEKGHGDLVEAVADLAARGIGVSLVLAGDGSARDATERKAVALGVSDRVHFTGYVDAPARILEESDLMVLPSHTEGLPNAVLEALALNVPVLATDVGGTPEVITDRQTGRLVPPRSPRALADGIIDFLQHRDDWLAMAARGRALVREQFDFGARTRRLEAIYRDLAEGAGR